VYNFIITAYAPTIAMAGKFMKLLSFRLDSRYSTIMNRNEIRTNDLIKPRLLTI